MTIDHLLAPDARLETVAEGFSWCEGPAWIPARSVLRFSDIPGNRVLEFSEADGTTVEISTDAEFTNGRTLTADGAVVECSHGRRALQIDRDASRAGAPYAPEVLVDRFGEARLNTPNDVVEKSDGTLWFTDPAYGIKRPAEGHAGEEEYGDRYVFRIDPADDTAAALRARGASTVAITAGPDPVRWWQGERHGEITVPRIDAVDTLGAGDVFHGAYAHALAAGAGIEPRLRYAAEVAAIRSAHVGPRSWVDEVGRVVLDARE